MRPAGCRKCRSQHRTCDKASTPECKIDMDEHVVKLLGASLGQKYWILKDLKNNYYIKDGYFYPYLADQRSRVVRVRGP